MFIQDELQKRDLPEIWPDKTVAWETRRREIAEILQGELFGYRPPEPEEIAFVILPDAPYYRTFCAGKVSLHKIAVKTVLNGKPFSFPFYAAIPQGKTALPFFVHINFDPDVPDRYRSGWLKENRGTLLISRGIGTSVVPCRLFCYPQIHCIELTAN